MAHPDRVEGALMGSETKEKVQAAACTSCGEAWLFPRDLPDSAKAVFPLDGGPWKNPCPKCGGVIWVAQEITADEYNAMSEVDRG
jgi:predicted RNA-binding Zn-ribbon protein involved in translation (DUF1610 family)